MRRLTGLLLLLAVGMIVDPPMANAQNEYDYGPYLNQITYLGRCHGTDYCWEFDLDGGDHTCGVDAGYPYYWIDVWSQSGDITYQGVSGYSYSYCQVNIRYAAEVYEWCLENYNAGCDHWEFRYWDSNTSNWILLQRYLFFQEP